jgi:hypothetical protein
MQFAGRGVTMGTKSPKYLVRATAFAEAIDLAVLGASTRFSRGVESSSPRPASWPTNELIVETLPMPINLKGRSLLSMNDLNALGIRFLLRLAAELTSAKLAGHEPPRLQRRSTALIF